MREKPLDVWICGMLPGGDWRIQNEQVKELTYGHLLLMERMLCNPAETIEDVAHCIGICSRNYEDGKRYIYHYHENRVFMDEFRDLVEKASKSPDAWFNAMDDYIAAHFVAMPILRDKDQEKCGIVGSPYLAIIRIRLIRLGYRPHEIFDTPIAHCILDIQTDMDLDGLCKVRTRESYDELDRVDRAVAQGVLKPIRK